MYTHNINTLYTRICILILQAFQPESRFGDWRQRELSGSSLLIRHKLIYIFNICLLSNPAQTFSQWFEFANSAQT